MGGGDQGIFNDRGHYLAAYALLLFHVIEYCEEVLRVHELIFSFLWRRLLAKKRAETTRVPTQQLPIVDSVKILSKHTIWSIGEMGVLCYA